MINNAGIVIGKSILDLSEQDITKYARACCFAGRQAKAYSSRTLSVNTLAHFWTIKTFLPDMAKAGHGHFVNVSSFLGTIGVANLGRSDTQLSLK